MYGKMVSEIGKYATAEDNIRVYKIVGKGQVLNFGKEMEVTNEDIIIIWKYPLKKSYIRIIINKRTKYYYLPRIMTETLKWLGMEHLINEKTVDNEYVNSKQTVCPACEGFSLVKSSNVRGRIKRKKPDIAGNNHDVHLCRK